MRTINIAESSLRYQLEMAFVAGQRAEFDRLDRKLSA
jgi:hypothetical protein